jgi:hypothetical protein
LLVAGERRLRALKLKKETKAPCFIRHLTKEQIADAQFLENVERQNLNVLETTRAIQRRIDELKAQGVPKGEITPAILKKFGRDDTGSNRSWLSNMMALGELGDAGREALGLTDNIQAVAAVARLEKQDPAAAHAVIAETKKETEAAPRLASALLLDKSQSAKDKIRADKGKPPRANAKGKGKGKGDNVATAPDGSSKEPGVVTVSLPGIANGVAMVNAASLPDTAGNPALGLGLEYGEGEGANSHAETALLDTDQEPEFELISIGTNPEKVHPGVPLLNAVLQDLEAGETPENAIAMLAKEDVDKVRDFLMVFFEAGKKAVNAPITIMAGLRRGIFGYQGVTGAQLSAFLHGHSDHAPRFHLLKIIGAMRKTRIDAND